MIKTRSVWEKCKKDLRMPLIWRRRQKEKVSNVAQQQKEAFWSGRHNEILAQANVLECKSKKKRFQCR